MCKHREKERRRRRFSPFDAGGVTDVSRCKCELYVFSQAENDARTSFFPSTRARPLDFDAIIVSSVVVNSPIR